ncbi:MAG: SpoIIE family protein phosphatase [Bacteroidales bacterium]|nr:SpoIIE family protein phosphatase [Bacteroidales bacterium]
MKKTIISIILLLFSYIIFAQTLSPDLQTKINEYQQLVSEYKDQGNNSGVVNYLSKIGNIYWQNNIPDKAITAYNEALVFLQNSSNTSAIININNQLGNLYMATQNYAKAEEHFNTSYNLIKDFSDKATVASALTNIGQCQQNQNKYNEAIVSFNEALTLALELNNLQMCKNISLKLANCYKALNDNQNHFKYYNLSANFDKMIKDQELQQQQQQLIRNQQLQQQMAYNLELQEKNRQRIADSLALQQQINENNIIQLQFMNKQQELQKQEITRQQEQINHQKELDKAHRTTITVLSIAFIFILIAFFFILRMLIVNKKQKNKLQTLNTVLSEKNIEIEKHRKNLELKNKQISDSINYASRIQRAILPVKMAIEKNFKNVFIFYLPRDVVSGDFYWFTKIDNTKIIAAIDCTGHSVPGAFVSMIANTLLNEIVKAKKIIELDQILNKLNKGVVETLNSAQNDDDLNDGMDITLFRFDEDKRVAKFAAANHVALVYVEGKRNILEGDYYSIGGFSESKNISFSQKEIELGEKAQIYMFSDGYIDQFNEKSRRYMSKNFFKLIDKINQKPFKKQEKTLSDEFINWKGNYRQIDDVIVIGIEI